MECCGLVLGEAGGVRILPAANVSPDPSRHFEIDPVILIAAEKFARAGGPTVLGCYHSHPNGLGQPSPTDAALAAPDGRLWAIIAGGAVHWFRSGPDGAIHGRFTPVSVAIAG